MATIRTLIAEAVTPLATEIADDVQAIRVSLGNLADLDTAATNLTDAVNEVKALVGQAGAVIDDVTASASTVYSSSKTVSEITSRVTAQIAALVDGAAAAFDTLRELSDALANNTTAASALTTAVANRVRFDAAQTLSVAELAQVRFNLQYGDFSTLGAELGSAYNTALTS